MKRTLFLIGLLILLLAQSVPAATYDKTKPAGTDTFQASDDYVRANWDALQDALSRDHDFPGTYGSDAGRHNTITMQVQSADPTFADSTGFLYTKDVAGDVEIHYMDHAGNITQITDDGSLLLAEGDLPELGITASKTEINAALDGNTATAAELSTLHSSGITQADLIDVHADTSTAAERSTLASSGITNADLVKVHALTSTAAELNLLDADNRTVGDLLSETSAGTMGAIAAVAVGQYLKSAGAATKPAYGKLALSDTGVHITSISRSSSGAVTVTSGFRPSLVIFVAADAASSEYSLGFDNATEHYCMDSDGAITSSDSIHVHMAANHGCVIYGDITATSATGYTVTFTLGGTGEINVMAIALP